MECFQIDESGYTGHDLLNSEQRFQGATAIAISDEDAIHLIKKHFPNLQASELKYRALARRPGNHSRLINLQHDILTNYKCITYVCDKRYLLLLMFLDYATEPFYYKRGVNFYEDGQNYALASLLYYCGSTILGEAAFENLLVAFQSAAKKKTPEALNDLVVAARKTNWRKLPEALEPLAAYAAPECLDAIANPKVSTDAAFIVLLALVNRIEEMTAGPYNIKHDQSKNLLTYHNLLQRYINHNSSIEFHLSEITHFKLPLKLASVTQVNSKTSPAVQLADVMIGAAIEAANTLTGQRTGGLNPNDVLSLYEDYQLIHMLPSIDFEGQYRFRQGTQAAKVIDYFATRFRER